MNTKSRIIFLAVCFSVQLNAQLDTIKLYENNCGSGIGAYFAKWFWGTFSGKDLFINRDLGSYSYSIKTNQDSLVLDFDSPLKNRMFLFQFFDKRNRLWFEGIHDVTDSWEGEVTFYRRDGLVKRKEFWANGCDSIAVVKDSCGKIDCMPFDAPGPVGCWRYYRKDGTIRKTKNFTLDNRECFSNDKWPKAIIISKWYNKNGKLIFSRRKKLSHHFIWRAF